MSAGGRRAPLARLAARPSGHSPTLEEALQDVVNVDVWEEV